jgi:hypothetical protein
MVIWLRLRFPGLPVLLAKKDIAGAFRLLWIDPEDAELFGADIPWETRSMNEPDQNEPSSDVIEAGIQFWELEQGLTLIYLVASFGFAGSPGEWTPWGRGAEEFHRGHHPANGRRDGSTPFDSRALVDDTVLVEPLMGLRPWVSAMCFEEGARRMMGEEAINAEKDAVEGTFRTLQTIWGADIDTEVDEARLPDRRVTKGATLVGMPVYDPGNTSVTLKDVQRLRGTAGGWVAFVPGLENN